MMLETGKEQSITECPMKEERKKCWTYHHAAAASRAVLAPNRKGSR
jgi:hypothetical protein